MRRFARISVALLVGSGPIACYQSMGTPHAELDSAASEGDDTTGGAVGEGGTTQTWGMTVGVTGTAGTGGTGTGTGVSTGDVTATAGSSSEAGGSQTSGTSGDSGTTDSDSGSETTGDEGCDPLDYVGDVDLGLGFDPDRLVGVTHIDGDVTVYDLFEGMAQSLACLESIGGALIFESVIADGNVDELAGFSRLEHTADSVILRKTEGITDLDWLSSLRQIGGNLNVLYSPDIRDVSGVSGIESLGGGIVLEDLPVLETMGSFDGLKTLSGDVQLIELGALEQVAFPALKRLQWLRIVDNPVLRDLKGLDALESVSLSIWIHGNAGMTSVEGLGAMRELGGDLSIRDNAVLEDISALARIEGPAPVTDSVAILDNPKLDQCGAYTVAEAVKGPLTDLNPSQPGVRIAGNLANALCPDFLP